MSSDGAWSVLSLEKLGLNNMTFLRKYFADGPDRNNWLLLSTSGVHGTYSKLDGNEPDDSDGKKRVTVLIVSPRLLRIHYGHIAYEPEDEPYLRSLVEKTLIEIVTGQMGNLPHDVSLEVTNDQFRRTRFRAESPREVAWDLHFSADESQCLDMSQIEALNSLMKIPTPVGERRAKEK